MVKLISGLQEVSSDSNCENIKNEKILSVTFTIKPIIYCKRASNTSMGQRYRIIFERFLFFVVYRSFP